MPGSLSFIGATYRVHFQPGANPPEVVDSVLVSPLWIPFYRLSAESGVELECSAADRCAPRVSGMLGTERTDASSRPGVIAHRSPPGGSANASPDPAATDARARSRSPNVRSNAREVLTAHALAVSVAVPKSRQGSEGSALASGAKTASQPHVEPSPAPSVVIIPDGDEMIVQRATSVRSSAAASVSSSVTRTSVRGRTEAELAEAREVNAALRDELRAAQARAELSTSELAVTRDASSVVSGSKLWKSL